MRYVLYKQSLDDKIRNKDTVFYYSIVDTCTHQRTATMTAKQSFDVDLSDITKSANYVTDDWENILESNSFDEIKEFLRKRTRSRPSRI